MNSPLWAALSDWELNADFDHENTDRIQSAFAVAAQPRLIYRGDQCPRHLYHVTRITAGRPQRLSLHVRRIYLAMAANDRDQLAGALIDFYWILDGRGRALQARILGQVEPMLPGRVVQVLRQVVQSGHRQLLLELPLQHTVVANANFSLVV